MASHATMDPMMDDEAKPMVPHASRVSRMLGAGILLVGMLSVATTFAAAAEYSNKGLAASRTPPSSMFKVADTLFVSASMQAVLIVFLAIRGLVVKAAPMFAYKSTQAGLMWLCNASNMLITGIWCGLAVLDSSLPFSGQPFAWDMSNPSINVHMRIAFAMHCTALAASQLFSAAVPAVLFDNTFKLM